MSRVSDPDHCAPRAAMGVVRVEDLRDLAPEAVLAALEAQVGDRLPRKRA
jgi:hypothetical protein